MQGVSSLQTREEFKAMSDAINSVFQNFANFQGRATRSQYWYWILFIYIVDFGVNILERVALSHNSILGTLVSLAFIVPTIAVGTRRMHDVGKSGWWLLFPFVNLYFLVQPTGPMNKFDVVL